MSARREAILASPAILLVQFLQFNGRVNPFLREAAVPTDVAGRLDSLPDRPSCGDVVAGPVEPDVARDAKNLL